MSSFSGHFSVNFILGQKGLSLAKSIKDCKYTMTLEFVCVRLCSFHLLIVLRHIVKRSIVQPRQNIEGKEELVHAQNI